MKNRENVASALSSLGFKIQRSWHFAARDENTASAYINANGSIHDFGSGFHGDLADFLHTFMGMPKGESIKEMKKLLGMPIEIKFDEYAKPVEKKTGFIKEEFIKGFEQERRDNFGRFSLLLEQALPALLAPERKAIAQKYQIGYSKQADRLIMPIRDNEGRAVTLWKYNKFPATFIDKDGQEIKPSKVTFTKGRERVPFNLADLKEYAKDKNGWVLLCEGEKDTLNALGKGYRAVTLGGASCRLKEEELPLFEGLKVVICYDYDEAGKNGANNIFSQLQTVAAEVKVWDWEMITFQEKFELFKGFDLTDWLIKQ